MDPNDQVTDYGFNWGPLTVERCCSDEKKGWRIVTIKSAKREVSECEGAVLNKKELK